MELIIEEKNESNFESIINLNNEINQNINNEINENINNLKTNENNKGTNKGTDECMELKNIKYKTMLMKGVALKDTSSSNDLSNLDKFLDN